MVGGHGSGGGQRPGGLRGGINLPRLRPSPIKAWARPGPPTCAFRDRSREPLRPGHEAHSVAPSFGGGSVDGFGRSSPAQAAGEISSTFERIPDKLKEFGNTLEDKARAAIESIKKSDIPAKTRNWFSEAFNKVKNHLKTAFS